VEVSGNGRRMNQFPSLESFSRRHISVTQSSDFTADSISKPERKGNVSTKKYCKVAMGGNRVNGNYRHLTLIKVSRLNERLPLR